MKKLNLITASLFSVFLLQGCEDDLLNRVSAKQNESEQSQNTTKVEVIEKKAESYPSNVICMVDSFQRDDVLESCQPGERVLFMPNSWGNEQLPVRFAALYCDPRYSIALTKGAVSCVFDPANIEFVAERAVQKALKNSKTENPK